MMQGHKVGVCNFGARHSGICITGTDNAQ